MPSIKNENKNDSLFRSTFIFKPGHNRNYSVVLTNWSLSVSLNDKMLEDKSGFILDYTLIKFCDPNKRHSWMK